MTGVPGASLCMMCGANGVRRLGLCDVCGRSVCERCGNTQHIKGEKRIVHDDCLAKGDNGFSMIKFVK